MNVTPEELEVLLLENQNLIHWCLKPYRNFKNSHYDYDDLVQVANETFIKAVMDYDASKSKLSTFVVPRITNELNKFVRKNFAAFSCSTHINVSTLQLPETVSLNASIADEGEDLEGFVGKPDDNIELIDFLLTVEKMCHSTRLDGDELFTQWKLWRVWGYTQQEIADLYNVERATLAMRFKKIEDKLRFYYKEK